MGMKKACNCDHWNEAQRECLYAGSGCFYDDERKKPTVTEKFVQEAIDYIAEYPSFKRLEKKLKEAGVEIEKK